MSHHLLGLWVCVCVALFSSLSGAVIAITASAKPAKAKAPVRAGPRYGRRYLSGRRDSNL